MTFSSSSFGFHKMIRCIFIEYFQQVPKIAVFWSFSNEVKSWLRPCQIFRHFGYFLSLFFVSKQISCKYLTIHKALSALKSYLNVHNCFEKLIKCVEQLALSLSNFCFGHRHFFTCPFCCICWLDLHKTFDRQGMKL